MFGNFISRLKNFTQLSKFCEANTSQQKHDKDKASPPREEIDVQETSAEGTKNNAIQSKPEELPTKSDNMILKSPAGENVTTSEISVLKIVETQNYMKNPNTLKLRQFRMNKNKADYSTNSPSPKFYENASDSSVKTNIVSVNKENDKNARGIEENMSQRENAITKNVASDNNDEIAKFTAYEKSDVETEKDIICLDDLLTVQGSDCSKDTNLDNKNDAVKTDNIEIATGDINAENIETKYSGLEQPVLGFRGYDRAEINFAHTYFNQLEDNVAKLQNNDKQPALNDETSQNIETISISSDDNMEVISIVPDSVSESDDCGYHSSDFEFITEEEANENTLIINVDYKKYLKAKKRKNVPKKGSKRNRRVRVDPYCPRRPNRKNRNNVESDDRELSNIFHVLPMPVSDACYLEHKSVTARVPSQARYDRIGRLHNINQHASNETDDEEATESVNKIQALYRQENEIGSKVRRSKRISYTQYF